MLHYTGVIIIPRTARKKSNTGIYHLILRGINKQKIFNDDDDHNRFIFTLKSARDKSDFKIYAYCLMGNHIHILIKEETEDLGIILRRIGSSYVYWYNYKYERVGHLFQDRYKSETVEDDSYLLTVTRYIHQNPVKAGIVSDISSYRWSSYKEYIGQNDIIDQDFVLNIFNENRATALAQFEFFHSKKDEQDCLEIEESQRLKDHEAVLIIKAISGFSDIMAIGKLKKKERDILICKIKAAEIPARQISRLTGVNRNLIMKA